MLKLVYWLRISLDTGENRYISNENSDIAGKRLAFKLFLLDFFFRVN